MSNLQQAPQSPPHVLMGIQSEEKTFQKTNKKKRLSEGDGHVKPRKTRRQVYRFLLLLLLHHHPPPQPDQWRGGSHHGGAAGVRSRLRRVPLAGLRRLQGRAQLQAPARRWGPGRRAPLPQRGAGRQRLVEDLRGQGRSETNALFLLHCRCRGNIVFTVRNKPSRNQQDSDSSLKPADFCLW